MFIAQTPTTMQDEAHKGGRRAPVTTDKFLMCHSMLPANLAVLIVLPFLLLCYGVGNIHCSTVHDNRGDLHSLLDFKQGITSDPNGALNNWTTSSHFCRWNGVNCSSLPPYRVTMLNLTGQGLSGQISPSLGNLTFLKTLRLSNNRLYGHIPLLHKLQYLENLLLDTNLLQGVIPNALTNCSNLAILDLSVNNLNGVIPPNIGVLTKLKYISLYSNNLIGDIPPALVNITVLQTVNFAQNNLQGRIPDQLWHMPNIVRLYLDLNNLSGRIPQIMPNITSLRELSLTSNMLGNTLPSNLGKALPNIQLLYLANNNFEGQIPDSLGNAPGLQEIELSNNQFTGHIPSSFGKLLQLDYLNLGGNKLVAMDGEGWEFFDALANCSYLTTLILSNNKLEGLIPNSIGNLSTNLTYLEMGGNNLSGTVPSSIQKFNGLAQLTLDSNNLSGTIENWIGNLNNLNYLNLSFNSFTGKIPLSISDLTQLTILCLADNKFTGFIPPGLGNLKSMVTLNISYNNFQGSIPIEFGNFRDIVTLDLSSNKFTGEIPKTLGQFEHIQTIQMDQNILTGNIPVTFSNLKSIEVLNLSHNSLSGLMPTCLNDLRSLTRLDLSYNNFQGEIPTTGVFNNNATAVSLAGNKGLCGGATYLHMRPCHVISRRARTANYLVKILIPIFGLMSLMLLVYFLVLEKSTSRVADLPQLSFGEHFEKVTYNDLAQATSDFSEANLIGRGSYGSVYCGKMKESKMEVAVKVFNLEMPGAERSFMAECEALRSIQHRNLLPIITACSTIDNAGIDFKALVYELMPNGNLDTWLHHKGDNREAPKRLGLKQRLRIVVNVADGLDYLHHDCGRPTVHCDLKPSNILLDTDMNALLGDFGIARFYADSGSTWAGSISSIGVKGTIGYIPPEYGSGGRASTSGDVYSFGIVLLEILTGKRPTDPMFTDGLDIISFVENSFPDHIFHVIDVHLVEEWKNLSQGNNVQETEIYQCLVALLQVALSCTRSLPSERLVMKQVASKIHAIEASHLSWKKCRSTHAPSVG